MDYYTVLHTHRHGTDIWVVQSDRRSAAEKGLVEWIERYRQQGYYKDARGNRIPVDQLHTYLKFV
jgi:hypothetical protein